MVLKELCSDLKLYNLSQCKGGLKRVGKKSWKKNMEKRVRKKRWKKRVGKKSWKKELEKRVGTWKKVEIIKK